MGQTALTDKQQIHKAMTALNCIACHQFNGQQSGGMGAWDISLASQRLQKNWFHLYMRNPARFHPTVSMPSYWAGGVCITAA